MTHADELVLRTLVFQFDGRVVEIFGGPNDDVIRYHVALLKELRIGGPNRKGRSLVTIGSRSFYIDADEMQQLKPFLSRISEATRAARPATALLNVISLQSSRLPTARAIQEFVIVAATTGVLPQDTGVASALVNTMQQVGGSIGVSALSTIALSATAGYLATHRDVGRLVTPDAAIHGYTVAFTAAAIVFAVAAVLALGLLPSRQRQQAGGSLEGSGVIAGPATEADAAASDTTDQPGVAQ